MNSYILQEQLTDKTSQSILCIADNPTAYIMLDIEDYEGCGKPVFMTSFKL